MEFGIFDHLDATGQPPDSYYVDRLALISLYERLGFRSYHVAEHHSTPLSMAPSPTLFLSAIASQTTRLRFGPLVFALPLYHPLRLVQEICMLDQLSQGRLEIGFGRGASAIEASYFGNDHTIAEPTYREYLELILSGMVEGRLNGKGDHYEFDDVPLLFGPYQKPHPPLWYGVHSTESAARAARRGSHIVSLDSAEETRTFAEEFREVFSQGNRNGLDEPLIGISLFIFLADTDEAALAAARRAYRVWYRSFNYLFARHNTTPPKHQRPSEWDEMAAQGRAIAGSHETIVEKLEQVLNTSTASYLVGQFAFGDLSLTETTRSIELFAKHVMPVLDA